MSLVPKTILSHVPCIYLASLPTTQIGFEISSIHLAALLFNHYMHNYMGIILTLSQVKSHAWKNGR